MMDNLHKNHQAGHSSFGLWLSVGNSLSAEMVGQAGFDFVVLDMQHGGIGAEHLVSLIQALGLKHNQILVRVPWNDPALIMRALDVGAHGVIVPMVSSVEDAQAAAAACAYPPQGIRSFGTVRNYYGGSSDAPTKPLCLVMIETTQAMDNVDAIASVDGVDGLFVGPVDLALSMGLGAALQMPEEILSAVDQVVAACTRVDKLSGCASLGLPNAKLLAACKVGFITLGSDIGYIRRGAAADLAEVRG